MISRIRISARSSWIGKQLLCHSARLFRFGITLASKATIGEGSKRSNAVAAEVDRRHHFPGAYVLILGIVMDAFTMMLITVPSFAPLVTDLGYSPIWWGILTIVCMEAGQISPALRYQSLCNERRCAECAGRHRLSRRDYVLWRGYREDRHSHALSSARHMAFGLKRRMCCASGAEQPEGILSGSISDPPTRRKIAATAFEKMRVEGQHDRLAAASATRQSQAICGSRTQKWHPLSDLFMVVTES